MLATPVSHALRVRGVSASRTVLHAVGSALPRCLPRAALPAARPRTLAPLQPTRLCSAAPAEGSTLRKRATQGAAPAAEGGEAAPAPTSRPRYSSRDLMARALESENVTLPSSIKQDLAGMQPAALVTRAKAAIVAGVPAAGRWLAGAAASAGRALLALLKDPSLLRVWAADVWTFLKKEAKHYYLGFRLLGQDVSTCARLLRRVAGGHELTRRERKLLVRTTSDLFRLIPLSVFLIVPFMEALLPVALVLFPDMLPSQFQSSLAREENMKRQLKVRVELAQFLSETSAEYSRLLAARGEGATKKGAEEMLALLKRSRTGEALTSEELLSVASLFSDELTLENISKAQLLAMAQYMGVSTFGTEPMLRGRLRSKMRDLKGDDKSILWEGVDSLSKEELQDASAARGMPSVGVTAEGLRTQLSQWLELSVNRNVPMVMLILSRAMQLQSAAVGAGSVERVVEKSIAALDEAVVAEAVLSGASEDSVDATIRMRELQLQAVQHQTALIDLERSAGDAAAAADAAVVAAEEARAVASAAAADATAGRGTQEAAAAARAAASDAEAAAAAAQQEAEALFAQLSGATASTRDAALADVHSRLKLEAGALDEGVLADRERLEQLGAEAGLTTESISALTMLASDSAVLQERAALAKLKARRMHEQAEAMLARGRVDSKKRREGEEAGAAEEAAPASGSEAAATPLPPLADEAALSRTQSSVQSMLDSMLVKLESQVDVVDERIGDRLHLLDRDRDGVLSREELEDVVRRLMVIRGVAPGETTALGDLLDMDKDGRITTDDLHMIADALHAAKTEAEHAVADADSASDTEGPTPTR